MDPAIILGSLTTLITSPTLWGLMLAAIPMGMVFGAVPGLGGKLGIVFAIPFVYGMQPLEGAVFLLAMHSVVHTGGAIPSILLGIPGTGPDAATVCDGHPMAQRGEAGRALGASLAASAVGGVLGAVFLAALIPVFRPLVLAFGPAEFFFLAVLGITLIAVVSGADFVKGVLVGSLGLILSFVGADLQTGILRFAPSPDFLGNGVGVITAVLGIFTLPEAVALASTGRLATASRKAARYRVADLMEGIADVGRHWGLTVRTSLMGTVLGLVPGLGGDVASWMCYGHAVQSSKSPERFGHGAVEGVIGPEAANNSKEGGALLPTIFFGVPGSSGMAVMLGAFVMLGIQPGPQLAGDQLGLVWTLIWTLAISNVVAALMFLATGPWLAMVTFLRAGLLLPVLLLLTLVGAYAGSGHWDSLVMVALLGVLGVGLKRGGWPRAPFAIGIVLGPLVETSLHQSLTIWGPGFVVRPIAFALFMASVGATAVAWRRARGRRGGTPLAHLPTDPAANSVANPLANMDRPNPSLAVAATLFGLFATMVAVAATYPPQVRLVPLVFGIPAMVLALWQMRTELSRHRARRLDLDRKRVPVSSRADGLALWWVGLFVSTVLVAGFVVGGTVAVIAGQRVWLKESWRVAVGGGCAAWLVTYVGFDRILGLRLFGGWLVGWMGWLR